MIDSYRPQRPFYNMGCQRCGLPIIDLFISNYEPNVPCVEIRMAYTLTASQNTLLLRRQGFVPEC